MLNPLVIKGTVQPEKSGVETDKNCTELNLKTGTFTGPCPFITQKTGYNV